MSRDGRTLSIARAGWAAVVLALVTSAAAQEPTAAPPSGPPPLATAIARQANLEGRVLWMDATANLQRLSTREGISAVMEKARAAGFNTIVVDVKPLSGHVLWDSAVAPRLKHWRGFDYPADHDLLLTCKLEAARRGMRVYAAINVFSEGHKLVQSGPLYDDPERAPRQAIVYDVRRTVQTQDGAVHPLLVGENRGPSAEGELAAYTPAHRDLKRLSAEDAAVVVEGDRVAAVLDGALTDGGGLRAPPDGHLLVGRGSAGQWLLEHVRTGEPLTYTAEPVMQPILEAPSETIGAFVNPADPESRSYALQVVQELASRYAIDGLVFDRMRYASLRTDFSPKSRELFEAWLGRSVEQFPQDVFAYDPVPGRPIRRGPLFKQWLEWRARTIHDWLEEARQLVQRTRPSLRLGAYVGSWYGDYYPVGVNWGADDYSPRLEWMSEDYPSTGYARKLNWITTGCYYGVSTRDDARQLGTPEEETVQAAAETSVRAVHNATFVYAGLQLLDYKDRPDEFRRALQAALDHSQGVMIFDLVYLEEYDWWNIVAETFATPKRAPHDVPGLQAALWQAHQALAAFPPSGARGSSPR